MQKRREFLVAGKVINVARSHESKHKLVLVWKSTFLNDLSVPFDSRRDKIGTSTDPVRSNMYE